MIGTALVVLVALAGPAVQSTSRADCTEWHECRQQALAAADRGEYETFHDLAWRAVQKGPPRDPALMYVLARAQALSGRPHDALVMLDRLAQMGVASDALTNPDFERTRQLPGWPEVAQRIERLTSPAPSSSTSAASTSPGNAASAATSAPAPRASASAARADAASTSGAPDAASADASAATSVPRIGLAAAEAARFPIRRFSPAGLAYDSVSRRLLVGDRVDRKLIVVGDGANHADDLVRSDSAGFQDISAMDVDARRGDLWVASTAASDGSAALHKLQLVSGRPLKAFPVAAELQPVKFVDVATTPSGVVVVLDSIGNRLFVLRPGETTIKAFVPLNANDPTSVATAAEDGVAYVAHDAGLLRVDLHSRTVSAVTISKRVSLGRIERIRAYRNALIAVDANAEGARRILRLDMNAAGRAVTRATTLEALAAQAGETFVTISGDELLYLSATPSATDMVTYRVRLR